MSKTLAERFIAQDGAPLEVNGQTVVNIYRRVVCEGQKISVRARTTMTVPSQGIRMKLSNGVIRINDQNLKEVVIWIDTAPEVFEFSCHPKTGPSSELKVWNCWRDAYGIVQAWVGNAGMVVEEADDRVTLECSTGTREFDPSQLEITLALK